MFIFQLIRYLWIRNDTSLKKWNIFWYYKYVHCISAIILSQNPNITVLEILEMIDINLIFQYYVCEYIYNYEYEMPELNVNILLGLLLPQWYIPLKQSVYWFCLIAKTMVLMLVYE